MTSVDQNFVEFKNIQKTYDGEHLVIKDLNLDVARGEFVTLLGPSGSGKSTALMLLAGFELPTRGSIRLNGRELNAVAPYDRNIGLVFQNYALFPHMTVLENVAYPLRVRKMNRTDSRAKAQRALEMVRLGQFGGRYPKQLSGGQQQRIAVARALVFDPALVLMDEPLGALDKKLREEMQVEIKHLHENLGLTVVFVTHDQDEALTMSDRIAVLNDGRIQQIDKPSTLYEKPVNEFVASFIGETNMMPCIVVGSNVLHTSVRLGCGSVISATSIEPLPEGTSAILSVRPERMTINPEQGNHSQLPAALIETIYHGSNAMMVFKLNSGETIMAQLRAGNPFLEMESGTQAKLAFSISDARIFAAS